MKLDNRKVKINHPMADTISISTGTHIYSGENSSEIAFFQNNDWVVIAIPEFCTYHDGSPSNSDTAVYPYVPNEKIENFLDKYRA
jgi:hypothetical protein